MGRKYLTLGVLCITLLGQSRAAIPETGKKYYLKSVEAGLYLTLSTSGSEAFIIDYLQASNDDFQFEFLPSIIGTEGYYNLATNNRGDYMYMNDWHCSKWGAPDDAKFDIKITNLSENTYKLSFANRPNQVIGLDDLLPGSPIYSDKTETDYHQWELIEVPSAIPLEIVKQFPEEGATDVSITDEIKVIFNDRISLEKNAVASIKDEKNQEVTGVNISANHNMATITHDPLAPETTYTVSLPAGTITGLNQTITWSFTTSEAAILPVDGSIYTIRLDGRETCLTLDRDQQAWLNNGYEGAANQHFLFKQVNSNPVSFVIQDLTGGYLNDAFEGITNFESESVILRYEMAERACIRLVNLYTNQYLGAYTSDPGSLVHFKALGELGAIQTWKLVKLNGNSNPEIHSNADVIQAHSENGRLVIRSIHPVYFRIYNGTGQKIAAGSLAGNQYERALPAGIYIVKTNHTTKKLIVK